MRRFRPNLVIAPNGEEQGFVEHTWIGQRLSIGEEVQLQITGACPRCVMTTLPQDDLPTDLGILRTAARSTVMPPQLRPGALSTDPRLQSWGG